MKIAIIIILLIVIAAIVNHINQLLNTNQKFINLMRSGPESITFEGVIYQRVTPHN